LVCGSRHDGGLVWHGAGFGITDASSMANRIDPPSRHATRVGVDGVDSMLMTVAACARPLGTPRLQNDAYPGNTPAVLVRRRPAPGTII